MSKLNLALQAVTAQLSRFASGDSYWRLMGEVFGTGEGQSAAHAIETLLRSGDLAQLARLEVISAAELGSARAAYASANGTIYLSDRFLAQASQAQLQAALLEEYGHAIDARLNASDTPGDEGELFSLRVRGITPSAAEQQRILAEDDRRMLTRNGVTLQVEQAAPVVYETTTINGTSGGGSGSFDYQISGLNAAWEEQSRNANRRLKFFNGSSISTIATSPYRDFGTYALSGATVAYTKSDGQDMEVYRFSGGITTRLTTNTASDEHVLIDGNTIVWQSYDGRDENGEIYRNNGTTTARITNNGVAEEDVQLSGNQLLWAASDGSDYEIYLNNGTTTRALTNNTFDDYSPVLSGNRVAWFRWQNDQENLFFFDGSTTSQVTVNRQVADPVIAGNDLVFKQLDATGKASLRFYNAATRITSQLSAVLLDDLAFAASGKLVAWAEPGAQPGLSTLKLFNSTSTTTVASNLQSLSAISFRGAKLFYGAKASGNNFGGGDLFLYDAGGVAPVSTQLTVGEDLWRIPRLDVVADRVLWGDSSVLKLTQPTTKPILSFASRNLSVVEGITSLQAATLTVTLSAASTVPVTVRWVTHTDFFPENEAFPGSDYTQSAGTLTFAVGVTSQTINVPILNDGSSEPDEQFYVSLENPSNAVFVPGPTFATVTISDTLESSTTVTLPLNVENLTLTGTSDINGTGNAGSNTILGNSGKNRLDGGGTSGFGSDQLKGGLGDDTYVINAGSLFNTTAITENPGEGVDTVEYSTTTTFGYTLSGNLEHLVLLGAASVSGSGNELDNLISGNSGDNVLDGRGGIDTVSYEGAPGPSGVTASLSGPFGGFGSASGWGSDSLTGFENIIGSNFADTLTGDGSANTLTGNAGKDNLTGGAGADRFVYRTLSHSLLAGFDRIADFDASPTGDRFQVSTARAGFLSGGQVTTLLTDASLTAAAISSKLTITNFLPNFAATVTMGSGLTGRTFMVINDAVAGFNAATDAVIEVTGFTGAFGPSMFVTS